jgi:hypothetical protein
VDRLEGCREVSLPGHHENELIGPEFADHAEELQAVHSRHLDVARDEVERLRVRLEPPERVEGVARLAPGRADPLHGLGHGPPHGVGVGHDEDSGLAHASPAMNDLSRPRRRRTAWLWICETRDSVTSRTLAISFIVSSSK